MACSLNSILTTRRSTKVNVKRPKTAVSYDPRADAVDAKFQKIRSQFLPPTPSSRPPSPLHSHASEAHIHRIRTATGRAESKEQFKANSAPASASPSLSSLYWPESQSRLDTSRYGFTRLPAIAEEDEDDAESIDWAGPLDITSYFYKREYIIEHNQRESKDEEANWRMSRACPSKEGEELSKDEEPEETLIHSTLVESLPDNSKANDISSSAKKKKSKSTTSILGKGIPDYLAMVKDLNNEIRELKLETQRMDVYSPRTNKLYASNLITIMREEPREDTIARAYETLKQMYWLNPSLTEFAAKKRICGPPGNHWMGLSRVEVMKVMKRVRSEAGASPRNYKDNPSILSFYKSKFSCALPPRVNKKSSKTQTKTAKPKSSTPRLKRSPLPIQHVPGPKHLHTNICIRPWEPTWDGWSQEEDEPDDSELQDYQCPSRLPSPSPQVGHTTKSAQLTDSTLQKGSNNDQQNADEDDTLYENDDETEAGGDDFITLEIFNPTYRLHR